MTPQQANKRPGSNFTDDETALYESMSEISEDCWCAGWMCGNEYSLWSALQDGELKYGMSFMNKPLLAKVAALSVQTGKWIVWRDDDALPLDQHGPYAIDLSDWCVIYDARNDLRRAPAPTEPAVDRDAWVQTKEGLPIPKEYARRLYQGWQAMSGMNLSFDGFIAKYGYFLSLDSIIACWDHHKGGPAIRAALATPASPAVSPPAYDPQKLRTLVQWFVAGDLPEDLLWKVDVTADSLRLALAEAMPAPAPLAPIVTGESDEDAALIQTLGNLLAKIAITMKGPEPALKRWSYHDLPEMVAVMAFELDMYRTIYGTECPAAPQLPQASQPTSTPEAVNLLVEEAKRVIGKN